MIEFQGREFQGMAGAYMALITPFTKSDLVNEEAVAQLVDYGLRSGIRGFYLTGGTGEFTMMTVEERIALYRAAAKANRGRGKLIAHVGAARTDDAETLARAAADCGCDWVSSVGTIYFSPSQSQKIEHYRRISEASDLPLMIYLFGTALEPDLYRKLFEFRNIKGMKYTASDYYGVQAFRKSLKKETLFFSGRDEMLGCALALGDTFAGGIGTTYNMLPKHYVKICEASEKGDGKKVRALQQDCNNFVDLLLSCPNWSCWKAMMKVRGIDCGHARMPVGQKLSAAEQKKWCAKFEKVLSEMSFKE